MQMTSLSHTLIRESEREMTSQYNLVCMLIEAMEKAYPFGDIHQKNNLEKDL